MIKKPSRHSLRNAYKSTTGESILLLLNSFLPFFTCWSFSYLILEKSYLLSLLCSLIAAGFLVRIFTIQHDCGHGAIFKNRTMNDYLGRLSSVLTIVPYDEWKKYHAQHHATSGNLDKRGPGNINTLTVKEYLNLPRREQYFYRVYRHPAFIFLLAPILLFFILKRMPLDRSNLTSLEARGIWLTNLALFALVAALGYVLGYAELLLVHIPILVFTAWAGTWIFYVQHQFEDAYWEKGDNWNFDQASMQGSSYYKLPTPLRWLSNNICIHHIHHYQPSIPSHKVNQCFNEVEYFRQVKPLNMRESLKNANLSLWDETKNKMIRFSEL